VSGRAPESEGRPLTFVLAAIWTLLVAVLVSVMISVIDAVHPGAFVDVVTVATCKLLAYSLVLFAILRLHEPESSIRSVLALRRPPAVVVLLAAVVGAGLAPGAMWLDGVFAKRFPPSEMELEAYARIFDTPTLGKKIALLVAIVIVMPVCDELFFRGVLFTPLKRGRRAETVILATAAYDTLLGGAQPREIASILATALTIAWLRAATGSVFPSVAARVAFFGVQVVPIVFLTHELSLTPLMTLGGVAAALLALVGIAAVSKRSARALAARLEDG
jgi:uncharacterized protein